MVTTESRVLFLDLSLDYAPAVHSSVGVLEDLSVQVFLGGCRLHNLADVRVPSELKDLRELDRVLQSVEKLQSVCGDSEKKKEHQLLSTALMLLDEVSKEYELQERHACNLQLDFLRKIPEWLDYWASLKHDAGHLTKETHLAFGHTSHALHEISVYCLDELKFRYVLLEKFQTDSLEDRFGKYRQLSGAQYHILIRQIYESENKLRLQKVLDLPNLDVISQPIPAISVDSLHAQFSITVTNADVAKNLQ
ncbi:hypothetical protein HPB50_015636 [Hyalomma asiaticum]|uniref:Uncharacterized protein n=1 Tax=Hyalomma asiaticum TaxID=266040 RepID=A0ACB7TH25_HYAAI|nr:hypothetical protein HPB50_015636 [Hyalomma asiaticum]